MIVRPIPGWPGYFASDDGRVWSGWTRGSRPRLGEKTHELVGTIGSHGYAQVTIGSRSGPRRRGVPVHVLVLEAFVGPRPPQREARHLDGNQRNNSISNLEWGTRSENCADVHRHGHKRKCVIRPEQWTEIVRRNGAGESATSLGRIYGVTTAAILHGLRRARVADEHSEEPKR